MVLTCSPQQRESNSLRFSSPSQLYHLDPASTLLQLRRAMSRSPSKSPASRLASGKSAQSIANTPLSPLPRSNDRSVSRLPAATQIGGATRVLSGLSSLGSDIPTNSRSTRLHLRKYSPLRQGQRAYGIVRPHPSRRVLGESSDAGNAGLTFSTSKSPILEKPRDYMDVSDSVLQPPKPKFKGFGDDKNSSVPSIANAVPGSDTTQSPQPPQSQFSFRSERHSLRLAGAPVKSSPLKRADGPSRTDPTSQTSPSAKRRSLNGSSDFNIFEHFDADGTALTGRASPEPATKLDDTAPTHPVITRRMGSLRKSTIQQRHERPPLSRLAAELYTASSPNTAPTRKVPSDVRAALPTRRNLFANEQSMETVSTSGLNQDAASDSPRVPLRHPLSRTITQSSSGDERAQDSPTHVPMRAPPSRRPINAFARSLPLGVERRGLSLADSSVAVPSNENVETPADYKSAKPLQAVFNSTGLVSKRMRDLRHEPSNSPIGVMPDTPCKRPMPTNPMAPSATPAPPPRHAQLRQNVHSFGAPSTPFNARASRPTPGANGRGVGIFGSAMGTLNRRGSFLDVDGDDANLDNGTSQSFELPSTPSKTSGTGALASTSHQPSDLPFESREEGREVDHGDYDIESRLPKPMPHCKFLLSSPDGDDACKDTAGSDKMDESPSAQRQFASLGATSLSTHQRPTILCGSPSSNTRKALTLPHIRTGNLQAKRSSLSPASPMFERVEQSSPHTPKDLMKDFIAPPDPSGLSISVQNGQGNDFRQSNFAKTLAAGVRPPATPTANRESSRFESHRLVQSTAHAIAEAQLDPSLTSRFDVIEMIGDGEFSAVFKVTKRPENAKHEAISSLNTASFGTDSTSSSQTVVPSRVYAVKKSRNAFLGAKDRAFKLQEVEVLRALGRSEHTVELFDHWEFDSHLYIQTEFCEEGSLDKFLSEVGRSTRLDDFRVWKILYESSLGLSHIHHSGFMHLDLKPANILISFDGSLKIADFGLAAPWPAAPGLEAEGDREYIAPEVLVGKVDKPSDIFALGLIVVEIAGNVVLPDNGPSWRRLREGDLSDVPPLTAMAAAAVDRDENGFPMLDTEPRLFRSRASADLRSETQGRFLPRLLSPPPFMMDRHHSNSLDNVVKRMIDPVTANRPTVDELLQSPGLNWVGHRHKAPATVFEGEWGPQPSPFHISVEDAEMIDV